MKTAFVSASVIWLAVLWTTSNAQTIPTTPAPELPSQKKEAVDILRPVTPDDRQDADLLYWQYTKLMLRGVIVMPSRGPVKSIVVDFSVFPIWSNNQQNGVVSAKMVQPDNRVEPRSFWEIKESVRLLPKPLLERLEKTWDKALTTARVQSRQGVYIADGTIYEFRGGEGSDRYVVQAHSPSSGVPLALVHLTDALIDYCGANGQAPREGTSVIEEALKQLEESVPALPDKEKAQRSKTE
jgi:hypothetical protein